MVGMWCTDHATVRAARRGVLVWVCEECEEIRFRDVKGERDPWDAVSALFGSYELVGRVDTIRAPAGEVLAYRPEPQAGSADLDVIPTHRWLRVNEHLWMCHDGGLLLLAHRSALVSRMVGA